ncbi:MAG TPA: FmdB family zinc ribbon protein [Burkholderiales bacterium]|nr:FmdB family zinc ribbon protein [Burkholderiales bacterium]
MPIYEYRCGSCGFEKEYLQKLTDSPIVDCPACGKAQMSKLVSAAGFQLKGTGWYATDFKGGGKPQEKKDDTKGEAKSESKADSKSDGASESTPACGAGACPACQ